MSVGQAFKVSVVAAAHTNYGLTYPVTYKFAIPADSSGLKCYTRRALTDPWVQLTEKIATDFFNGIECVRFDYTNNFAYVSIGFGSSTDVIYIMLTSSIDGYIVCTYDSICAYYDNRVAVFTSTYDDLPMGTMFLEAYTQYAARNLQITFAVLTGLDPPPWATMQTWLDSGYCEVANHSATHPALPYGDYDAEITGSRTTEFANLDLPAYYKKDSTEYMPAWIEPNGESDATIRTKLGQAHYLADRSAVESIVDWAAWDAANGLYAMIGYTDRLENETEVHLKAGWDTAYAAGKIYHLMGHPGNSDWSAGQKPQNFLDYVYNKLDVWYVGFGAMYMYHYAQERGDVTVVAYVPPVVASGSGRFGL